MNVIMVVNFFVICFDCFCYFGIVYCLFVANFVWGGVGGGLRRIFYDAGNKTIIVVIFKERSGHADVGK